MVNPQKLWCIEPNFTEICVILPQSWEIFLRSFNYFWSLVSLHYCFGGLTLGILSLNLCQVSWLYCQLQGTQHFDSISMTYPMSYRKDLGKCDSKFFSCHWSHISVTLFMDLRPIKHKPLQGVCFSRDPFISFRIPKFIRTCFLTISLVLKNIPLYALINLCLVSSD